MSKRILVVDDDTRFLRFMEISLSLDKKFKIIIDYAGTGSEAISTLNSPVEYGAIILALSLKDITGTTLAAKIKEAKDIPIAVLSPYVSKDIHTLITEAGCLVWNESELLGDPSLLVLNTKLLLAGQALPLTDRKSLLVSRDKDVENIIVFPAHLIS